MISEFDRFTKTTKDESKSMTFFPIPTRPPPKKKKREVDILINFALLVILRILNFAT